MNATAFPLTWPTTIPRSKEREKGKFQTSLAGALKNVDTSMQRFANDSGKDLTNIVISSNVTLGVTRPGDPGVAVWFTWDGLSLCIPVDRYASVEGNLQAIHHIIEARRVELRHGTLALVRATFQGFKALPKPAGKEWWDVLGVSREASVEQIRDAWRRKSSEHHPDKGGTADRMAEINAARETALKERS